MAAVAVAAAARRLCKQIENSRRIRSTPGPRLSRAGALFELDRCWTFAGKSAARNDIFAESEWMRQNGCGKYQNALHLIFHDPNFFFGRLCKSPAEMLWRAVVSATPFRRDGVIKAKPTTLYLSEKVKRSHAPPLERFGTVTLGSLRHVSVVSQMSLIMNREIVIAIRLPEHSPPRCPQKS